MSLVADHRLAIQNNKIDPSALAAVIADLKQKDPDLVVLAIGGARTPEVLAAFVAAGLKPPLFVTGRIETIIERMGKEYPGDIFQLGWDNLPDISSDRLRERIARNGLEKWIFEGAKVPEAPGWKSGECKARPEGGTPDVFDSRNMIAIGRGTQYADMVGLVADALKAADPRANPAALRAHMLKQLGTTYAARPRRLPRQLRELVVQDRARAPPTAPRSSSCDRTGSGPRSWRRCSSCACAPTRCARSTRSISTSTLIRTYRVDDNDKSFFADFYLSMRGNNASIKQIEFVNAFLDPKTSDRQITVRTLHEAGPSQVYPPEMNIYLVSGKFAFDPRLASYPFDTQRFAINIQAKSGENPFIVQPPPHSLRDKNVETDGWVPRDQYVGYDEDFVPTIDAWTFRQSIVPFYKASFVWQMQRQTTDYYLRVVVPLAFILAVAYMSIYIPLSHFEAIVTIQVTALLSAVALYLALPKVDAGDGTTMSDRIFLFIYTAVSLMIVLSILRITRPIAHTRWLSKAIGLVQVVVIPLMVVAMTIYVYRVSLGEDAGPLLPRLAQFFG